MWDVLVSFFKNNYASVFAAIIAFICGIFTGMSKRIGGHLFDSWLGRIRLDITPNTKAGARFHGFYAAAEVGDHKEDNNFFLVSCDLNNKSKKPFVIHDYEAYIQPQKDGKWIMLSKHESPIQNLNPTSNLQLSIDLSRFENNPIFIAKLLNDNSLPAELVKNVIFFLFLPLQDLRLNNIHGNESIKCKLRILERRGKWVERSFLLKRIYYKADVTGKYPDYFDDCYEETIPGSGVLKKKES